MAEATEFSAGIVQRNLSRCVSGVVFPIRISFTRCRFSVGMKFGRKWARANVALARATSRPVNSIFGRLPELTNTIYVEESLSCQHFTSNPIVGSGQVRPGQSKGVNNFYWHLNPKVERAITPTKPHSTRGNYFLLRAVGKQLTYAIVNHDEWALFAVKDCADVVTLRLGSGWVEGSSNR